MSIRLEDKVKKPDFIVHPWTTVIPAGGKTNAGGVNRSVVDEAVNVWSDRLVTIADDQYTGISNWGEQELD